MDTTRVALTWGLHLLVVALVAPAVVRAGAPATVVVAALLVVVYAAGVLVPGIGRSRRRAAWWLAAVCAVWAVLLVLTADALWVAFPLYFLQLHLLPRRAGVPAVAATALAAATSFTLHQGFTPAAVAGPVLGAAVAVVVVRGYEVLYRESERRRRLIEELTATRADLAEAQHAAGVLAERERLAREIHDTLAQGLSSIQLLLRAAERILPDRPEDAARHVGQARRTAVDNLAEARRFVAALSPPALDGTTLAGALERLCAATASPPTRFELTGRPVPLPTAHDVALLRIAQSALANTARHARARAASATLDYRDDEVVLTVTDDGDGFDPAAPPAPDPDAGGFGLAASAARARSLGGTLTVESAPGRGTALSARLPLPPERP
ncbi:histidine kinase [Actinosynnema sp. NPDC050436]|uniref:sensor histidine kinase n=1 Tax=Actinosynnema sp. NPDC050436 TaxID=3155659 RepID=UPI0033F5F26F